MSRRFSNIYKEAKKPAAILPFDPRRDRFVLFSDHHKGDASPADDFKKNASLYASALDYYRQNNFKLIVLGDNEELWENRYDQIYPHYKDIILQEIHMAPESSEGKKLRLWGNHDKEVSLARFNRFRQRKNANILNQVDYREGLCLGEDIFLVHGHQGRFFEDQAWRISRWAVQFIWKTIQMIFHIGLDGPAENYKIRDDLERSYYMWAKEKRVLLICGHTHRAIFGSMTHFDRLQIDIHHLEKILLSASPEMKKASEKDLARKNAEVKKILSRRSGKSPQSFESDLTRPVPCYFNDGCCGYTNGITCVEIDKKNIRLVKWQRQKTQRQILQEKNLQTLLTYIKNARPVDKKLDPELI
jgi:UDP-2,3-diacylglucosamine pyrophosphatase LpxH